MLLPRTIGSNDADPALADAQIDVFQHIVGAEAVADVGDFDHGLFGLRRTHSPEPRGGRTAPVEYIARTTAGAFVLS